MGSSDGLEATFIPEIAMTCCSLRYKGAELLSERYGLAAYASCGITMGMSPMHPWANRLANWRYTACGTSVRLPVSRLLHTDRFGLPVNGVHSCGAAWRLDDYGAAAGTAWLEATLRFDRSEQLELFPFPHLLRLRVELTGASMQIITEVEATSDQRVPVCFGYRIYLRAERPGGPTIVLPDRRRLATDERLLPTGRTEAHSKSASSPGIDRLHEVIAFVKERRLTVATSEWRFAMEAHEGFPFAQVRSVAAEPHVMLEALTAAPDALSRNAFPTASPQKPYRAALRMSVASSAQPAVAADRCAAVPAG